MFKRGEPRPPNAGRKKGTPNKKRVPLVSEYLASKGINPINEILKLLPTLDPDQRLSAWKTLLSHTQPSLKNLEGLLTPPTSPAVSESDAPSAQLLQLLKRSDPSTPPTGTTAA